MLLVTGATGTIGAEVARGLASLGAVRILARRPEAVTADGPHVEIVEGDYADPRALERAFEGVRAAFLVTNRPGEPDDERLIGAARDAGTRHLVKLSAAAVGDRAADDLITGWQRGNERLIQAGGPDWTLLRPRSFMSNTLSWVGSVRSEGVVRALYGTSSNACVDPRDVAEVAVRVMTEPGHAGQTYTLSGPEAISARQQTEQLADVLGRALRFEELTESQVRTHLARRYPPEVADALLASSRRQLDGAKTGVSQTVRQLTGRPARTFRAWAADHADAFA
ncbi:NAD(P)H-binding protein [Streptomyces sp. DT24]|uniref:NAD(P)H-binding protein n=1 Tax=Streptomyces sp. DT24 TaxID=3416520 RepID=UPI003CF09032